MDKELKRIFEREVNTNHVDRQLPFSAKKMINENKAVYNYVFDQFKKAKLTPSYDNYRELNEDKSQKTAKELYKDYREKLLDDTLPSEYYINDIHYTQFVKTFKDLDKILDQLEGLITLPTYHNELDQSKVYADKAMNCLQSIDDDNIKIVLIDWLLNHNTNIRLENNTIFDQHYQYSGYKKDTELWQNAYSDDMHPVVPGICTQL